ncbi:NAD(P)/FAD-dependent oxidoreductase [Paradesertivirga mongoliensis]|uniref:NAD(P)/FAD-dependent oxidoreductase n=1 Tax=Paradesertivirga mongoliensis TaxID=2100740 RepID=A0ABW4ZL00_9SPHI|nr:NAD(P)/FAD-dependent oxidoreductase [Pedobacter mongoliensis]
MTNKPDFDVIIIGGSYSGLSAAMALGRSLRRVLVIDGGSPCNRQTPHSHNFITHDGKTPAEISLLARQQVGAYETVRFHNGLAIKGVSIPNGFEIETESGEVFQTGKIIFATGIKDLMPKMEGFAECWGISVIHCPYCHGYEVKNEVTGILDAGDAAMHLAPLVKNLTRKLSIFTNGKSSLSEEQRKKLATHDIKVIETEIDRIEHIEGQIQHLIFTDGSSTPLKALYAKLPFVQHTDIPQKFGCELTEHGFIKTDAFLQTTIPGVYACGDCTTPMRSVASAVTTGNLAGAMANRQLCEEHF